MNYYGFLISLAVLVAALLGEKLAPQKETYWKLCLVMLLGGLVGARLYHVLDYWAYYKLNPVLIAFFWQGGLGIWGAVMGAALTLWLYGTVNKLQLVQWANVFAQVAPLAQAIGRLGNFFNHELFGLPTNLPWKIFIPVNKRPPTLENFTHFHPLFAYEVILLLMLYVLLKKAQAHQAKLYLAGYAVIRYFLEFLRINPWQINGINVAQSISILILITVLLTCDLHCLRPRGFSPKTKNS